MLFVLKALALFYLLLGCVVFIRPDVLKNYARYWDSPKRIKMGGIIALFAGIFIEFAASECNWPWFIGIFGLLALSKGFVILLLGFDKMRPVLVWYENMSDHKVRLMGVLIEILGGLIFLAV